MKLPKYRPRATQVAIAVGVLVAAIVGGTLAMREPDKPPATALATPKSPSLLGGYSELPAPVAQQPTQRAAPAAAPTKASRDAEYVVLAQGATYAERMKAYAMVHACLRERFTRIKVTAEPCELSPGRVDDVETRKRLVAECALKGECYAEFVFEESPNGLTHAFADSPQQWQQMEPEVRARAIATGNPAANAGEATRLQIEAARLAEAGDMAQAKALLIAGLARDVVSAARMAELAGVALDAKSASQYPDIKLQMPRYSALTQSEKDAAIAQGIALAQAAKKERSAS